MQDRVRDNFEQRMRATIWVIINVGFNPDTADVFAFRFRPIRNAEPDAPLKN